MPTRCEEAEAALRRAIERLQEGFRHPSTGWKAVQAAKKAAEQAQDELNAAEDAVRAACRELSGYVHQLESDPSLGVDGMMGGFTYVDKDGERHGDMPDLPVGGVEGIPLLPFPAWDVPTGTELDKLVLRGRLWGEPVTEGDTAAYKAWEKAAVAARKKARERADAIRKAIRKRADALKKRDAAEAALRDAQAQTQRGRQQDYARARAAAVDACGEHHGITLELPNGLKLTVEAGADYDEDLQKALDILGTLPAKEAQGISITVSADSKVDTREDKGRKLTLDVLGEYDGKTGTITIYAMGHDVETMKHEVGHNVLHRLVELGKTDKEAQQLFKDWIHAWYVDVVADHSTEAPSDYGRTDAGEGFAEAYRLLRDKEYLSPHYERILKKILDKVSAS